jgi:hypothetical protein
LISTHFLLLPDIKTEMEGWEFWRRGKGSSFPTHREEQYVPLISDLDTVAQSGTAPAQGPHLLDPPPAVPLAGISVVSPHNPWIRGTLRATLDHMISPQTCGSGHQGSLSLLSQATSHSHTFTHRNPTFPPHLQCPGVTVSLLLKATWVTLGGDQAPLLPLRGRLSI